MQGTGLTSGDAYDVIPTTPSTPNPIMTDNPNLLSNINTVRLEITAVTAGNNIIVADVPIQGSAGGSAAIEGFSIYFESSSDVRLRHEIYQELTGFTNLSSSAANTAAALAQNNASDTSNNDTTGTLKFSINLGANAGNLADGDILFVGLPMGSLLASGAAYNNALDTIGTSSVISISNRLFAYPSVTAVITTVSGTTGLDAVNAVDSTITNVTTPLAYQATMAAALGAGTANTACEGADADANWATIISGTKLFKSNSQSLSDVDVVARGFGSSAYDETIGFTTDSEIPAGGTIVLTLNGNWLIGANAVVSQTGLSKTSGTVTIGAFSGSAVTISNFDLVAASTALTITVTELGAPSSAGTNVDLVASLEARDASSNVINKWDTTYNSSKVTVTANSATVAYSSEWSVSIDPPN